jgi:hypothetical protein
VDECANWVVNIAKYARVGPGMPLDSSHAAIYSRRALARRVTHSHIMVAVLAGVTGLLCLCCDLAVQSVSLGLLVLMLDAEDLMLGRDRIYNAEHFTTLWKEHIRLFDEKAEALAVQYGPEVLFTEVAVCGNCHAVCKKLENLLKTLFVPRNNTAEATLHRALHAQEDYLPQPSPRPEDAGHNRYPPSSQSNPVHSAVEAKHPASCNQSDADDATDLDQQPSLDDDDDASIVPTYPPSLYSQFVAQQEQDALAQATEQQLQIADVCAAAGEVLKDDSVQLAPGRARGARKAVQGGRPTRSASGAVNLTEYYSSIASIFPAVQSLMSNRCFPSVLCLAWIYLRKCRCRAGRPMTAATRREC